MFCSVLEFLSLLCISLYYLYVGFKNFWFNVFSSNKTLQTKWSPEITRLVVLIYHSREILTNTKSEKKSRFLVKSFY